jgi:predicted nucleic-acid-binding Zn-ribbon protein
MNQCQKCGSSELEEGGIQIGNFIKAVHDSGLNYLSEQKRLKKSKISINRSVLCLNCGYVEFYVKDIQTKIKK